MDTGRKYDSIRHSNFLKSMTWEQDGMTLEYVCI